VIGSTYKKFASEHGMTVSSGVAYGKLYGYAATLSEGSGWKRIGVSCLFTDRNKRAQLQAELNSHNLMKEFRVQELALCDDGIVIVFHDNPGTMKKLRAFCEWFFPMLPSYGATGADICPECGQPITDSGSWQLVGEMAVHVHSACIARMQHNLEREEQLASENTADHSYLSGLVGALIGGLLGAVIWGSVLYLGYYASIVGVLIGVLASKGYDITRGKQQKGKIVIVLAVTILAVIAGTLGAYSFELIRQISIGTLPGYAYSDVFWMMGYMLQDPQFLGEVVRQILIGLLYALLGASVVLLRVHKDTKGTKIKQLK